MSFADTEIEIVDPYTSSDDEAGTYLIGYFDEGRFYVLEDFGHIAIARCSYKHYVEAPGPDFGVQVARIIEEGR